MSRGLVTAVNLVQVVSLFALVSAKWLGRAALVTAIIGLAFVAGSLLSLLRLRRGWSDLRDAAFLLGVLAVLVRELIGGRTLQVHPGGAGAAQAIAVLVVLCFVIGIARSWELIGGPQIGLRREVVTSVRQHSHEDPPPGQ